VRSSTPEGKQRQGHPKIYAHDPRKVPGKPADAPGYGSYRETIWHATNTRRTQWGSGSLALADIGILMSRDHQAHSLKARLSSGRALPSYMASAYDSLVYVVLYA